MEHLTLRTETDTATPRPVIPIFFIHSVKTPFCMLPGCWCQSCKAEVMALLTAAHRGEMLFQAACDFEEGKQP